MLAIQLLAGTAAGFWVLREKLGGEQTITIDTDWIYRKPFPVILGAVVRVTAEVGAGFSRLVVRIGSMFLPWM